MTSALTKYSSFTDADLDAADQKVDALAGHAFLTLDVGETVVRVLPAPIGGWPTFRVTAMHYMDAMPGSDKKIVFACPRVELKQPCPACAFAERLGASRNPMDKDRAKRASAGLRVYANVVNRANPDAGPRVLAVGLQIWRQIKAIRKNPRLGGDFTSPGADGFDLIITREGSGKNDTKYTVFADRNNSALAASESEAAAILQSQHNLDALVDPTIPVELIRAWQGMASAEATPTRGPALPPAARPGSARSAVIDSAGEQPDPFDDEI